MNQTVSLVAEYIIIAFIIAIWQYQMVREKRHCCQSKIDFINDEIEWYSAAADDYRHRMQYYTDRITQDVYRHHMQYYTDRITQCHEYMTKSWLYQFLHFPPEMDIL